MSQVVFACGKVMKVAKQVAQQVQKMIGGLTSMDVMKVVMAFMLGVMVGVNVLRMVMSAMFFMMHVFAWMGLIGMIVKVDVGNDIVEHHQQVKPQKRPTQQRILP